MQLTHVRGLAFAVCRERGMSSMLDTGAVLIDAATSPDRADEALSTLAPLIPGLHYFRWDRASSMQSRGTAGHWKLRLCRLRKGHIPSGSGAMYPKGLFEKAPYQALYPCPPFTCAALVPHRPQRFNPVDERYGMELDCVDPQQWAALQVRMHGALALKPCPAVIAASTAACGLAGCQLAPTPAVASAPHCVFRFYLTGL